MQYCQHPQTASNLSNLSWAGQQSRTLCQPHYSSCCIVLADFACLRFAVGLLVWTKESFWHMWCFGDIKEECAPRWLRTPRILLNISYCLLAMQVVAGDVPVGFEMLSNWDNNVATNPSLKGPGVSFFSRHEDMA
jgi:hypothetical protein